jgi:hypothetical protein
MRSDEVKIAPFGDAHDFNVSSVLLINNDFAFAGVGTALE